MSLKEFETNELKKFFTYKYDENNNFQAIELRVVEPKETTNITFLELFKNETTHAFDMYDENNFDKFMVSINQQMNLIAANTRRGTANLIFVHSDEIRTKMMDMYKQYGYECEVLSNSELPSNEVFVTYFKDSEKFVDGGCQVVNDKVYLHSEYQKYFTKIIFN